MGLAFVGASDTRHPSWSVHMYTVTARVVEKQVGARLVRISLRQSTDSLCSRGQNSLPCTSRHRGNSDISVGIVDHRYTRRWGTILTSSDCDWGLWIRGMMGNWQLTSLLKRILPGIRSRTRLVSLNAGRSRRSLKFPVRSKTTSNGSLQLTLASARRLATPSLASCATAAEIGY